MAKNIRFDVVAGEEPVVGNFDCHKKGRNAGRPAHKQEATPDDVLQLIKIATTKEAHLVSQWLRRKVNTHLDEELELLASHVLSEAEFDIRVPEVLGPYNRGNLDGALAAAVSRMKRKFAKLLRDHQRSENDDFLDDVQVVD